MPPLLLSSLSEIPGAGEPLALAIGAFDGIHRGHADVIRFAGGLAERTGVLRFWPHPARVLRPAEAPPLLCTEEQIATRLASLGVQFHIRLPFTPELAEQDPEAFLEELHSSLPGLKAVVVGPDWRFGRGGLGDIHLLKRFAAKSSFDVQVRPELQWKGERISSTRIRHAVLRGDLESAENLLGHPYEITGIVKDGKKFGRQLGFPTANLTPEQELMPPAGVYAMRVRVQDRTYGGAGYITHHPNLVEVHLLDFAGDLYGRRLAIDVLHFRRPPEPLPNSEILRRRIQEDVDAIRLLLLTHNPNTDFTPEGTGDPRE